MKIAFTLFAFIFAINIASSADLTEDAAVVPQAPVVVVKVDVKGNPDFVSRITQALAICQAREGYNATFVRMLGNPRVPAHTKYNTLAYHLGTKIIGKKQAETEWLSEGDAFCAAMDGDREFYSKTKAVLGVYLNLSAVNQVDLDRVVYRVGTYYVAEARKKTPIKNKDMEDFQEYGHLKTLLDLVTPLGSKIVQCSIPFLQPTEAVDAEGKPQGMYIPTLNFLKLRQTIGNVISKITAQLEGQQARLTALKPLISRGEILKAKLVPEDEASEDRAEIDQEKIDTAIGLLLELEETLAKITSIKVEEKAKAKEKQAKPDEKSIPEGASVAPAPDTDKGTEGNTDTDKKGEDKPAVHIEVEVKATKPIKKAKKVKAENPEDALLAWQKKVRKRLAILKQYVDQNRDYPYPKLVSFVEYMNGRVIPNGKQHRTIEVPSLLNPKIIVYGHTFEAHGTQLEKYPLWRDLFYETLCRAVGVEQ